MVISPEFVWLHFPKCAGSFTEKLLRNFLSSDPVYQFDPIDPANVIWHQDIKQREKYANISLSGKDVICNFRRLPFWMISRIVYEQNRSGHVTPKEMYRLGKFLEFDGRENHVDRYVVKYTKPGIKHWLRVEYLEQDFIEVFSKYFVFDPRIVSNSIKTKINASGWNGDINNWFDEEDLITLYKSCPKWTEIETNIYGNTLI